MCLRPSQSVLQPERPAPPFDHQWHWVEAHQQQRRQFVHHPNLNQQQHRNSMGHLLQIKFHPDYRSPVERKMLSMFASVFECSFLLVATISALFSIVQPKLKNGLVLMALPLCALIPAVTGAKGNDEEGEPAAADGQ